MHIRILYKYCYYYPWTKNNCIISNAFHIKTWTCIYLLALIILSEVYVLLINTGAGQSSFSCWAFYRKPICSEHGTNVETRLRLFFKVYDLIISYFPLKLSSVSLWMCTEAETGQQQMNVCQYSHDVFTLKHKRMGRWMWKESHICKKWPKPGMWTRKIDDLKEKKYLPLNVHICKFFWGNYTFC